jgi:hypothetical protein
MNLSQSVAMVDLAMAQMKHLQTEPQKRYFLLALEHILV